MSVDSFKYATSLGDSTPQEVVRDNVISFVDWGFLKIGSYLNVEIPSSGHYGGNRSNLRRVNDPRYTTGKVWEGYHNNWVWESGTGYDPEPIPISGVYINNTLATSGFYVDYPNGRIVFDNVIPANSSVQVNYSHKYISVVRAEDFPFFREGFQRSFRIDSAAYSAGSGVYNQLTDKKIQLPCIVIETVKDGANKPYCLGGQSKAVGSLILHVISEDGGMASRISNILVDQQNKTLVLFDSNYIKTNALSPLDFKGSLKAGAKTYPQMIAWSGEGGYRTSSNIDNSKAYIIDTKGQGCEEIGNNLYHSPVRWTFEAILPASL